MTFGNPISMINPSGNAPMSFADEMGPPTFDYDAFLAAPSTQAAPKNNFFQSVLSNPDALSNFSGLFRDAFNGLNFKGQQNTLEIERARAAQAQAAQQPAINSTTIIVVAVIILIIFLLYKKN